jgi:HlyD family secretion protein
MKRNILYGVVILLVLGTTGYFFLWNGSSGEVKYRTEKVTRGDIVQQVRATGTINPVQTVEVGSQVSGIIEKIFVDFNSHVKKGQVIARIDSTFLYAAVKQAQANVERNQAQVNDAKRTLARNTELFSKNLVAQADLDASTTAYEAAVAQLKQTQAALDQQNVNLYYAVIRSPIDGVVISRDVDIGQTVASSFQTPKLFEIANDLSHMQVEASVDEADIGQIRDGQDVSFTVDAYPEDQFKGTVSQVRLSPINVQNVITYTVIIDVPNPDLKLRPGMTATVSILVDKRVNVLRIPALATRFQPAQDTGDKSGNGQNGSARQTRPDSQQQGAGNPQVAMRQGADKQGGARQGSERQGGNRQGMGGTRSDNQGDVQKTADLATARPKVKPARVYTLDDKKTLQSVQIMTGLADNRWMEVLGDKLHEGQEVIVGYQTADAANGNAQSNPFQPRMVGPGGGGGGRGR